MNEYYQFKYNFKILTLFTDYERGTLSNEINKD